MTTTHKVQYVAPELKAFAQQLKEAGFEAYAPILFDKWVTWLYFVKNDKIGYVELGQRGFSFTSSHKPCRQCGTGFAVGEGGVPLPTVEMAEVTVNTVAPHWAQHDLPHVKKWANWAEFHRSSRIKYIQV